MKHTLLVLGSLACAGLTIHDRASAHGGSYLGPGDTVPPGGGGGGGGTGGGVSGPSQGGGIGTGGTTGPTQPGARTGGGAGRPGAVATGTAGGGTDLSTWEFWWGFNKHHYLRLKEHVQRADLVTGDDGFFAGGTQPRDTLRPSEETIRTKVVPALREALANERSNDIVTGALIALAKIGDERAEDGGSEFEPLIAKFLGDPNQEIAETAAIALGILANEDSIPALTDLALDTRRGRELAGKTEVPYRTRAFATYGLGLAGAATGDNAVRQRLVRILVDVLDAPAASTRDVQVAAVTSLGLTPIDHDPNEAPQGAADVSASRRTQIDHLRRMLKSKSVHDFVRAHVPTALARLCEGAPDELRVAVAADLLPALDSRSTEKAEMIQSTVLALGRIGDCDSDPIDARIRAALIDVATQGNQQARHFTSIALGQIGGHANPGADVEKVRGEIRSHLIGVLTKGRSSMKTWSALGLGVLEHGLASAGLAGGSASATSKEVVRKALADAASPEHVGAFSIALGIAGDVEARSILKQKFQNTSEANARGYVAIALGLVDARASIPEIQTVVRESKYKPELLRSAAIGLGILGDKDLVPYLCDMLAEAKGLSAQASIASALGFIGDSRSIDPLVAMLKRKQGLTDGARGFAAVALGIVADKERFVWNAKIARDINYRANTSTLTGENGTGVLDIL